MTDKMDEIIFKPKYIIRIKFFRIFSILAGLSIIHWSNNQATYAFLVGGFFVLIGILDYIGYPSEIRFGESEIIIKYLIGSNLTFSYNEFTDIWPTSIRFGHKSIPIWVLKNADEFVSIFYKLIASRKIRPPQSEAKYAITAERMQMLAKNLVWPMTLLFVAFILLSAYFSYFHINWQSTWLIYFLAAVATIYFVLQKMDNDNK